MAYDPEAGLRYCAEQRAKRKAEEEKKQTEEYQRYLDAGGTPKRSWEEKMYVDSDHPSTMENSTATLLYIIVMVIGAIFYARFLIWVCASLIYFTFINRRKIRQKKWDKMQIEKKKQITDRLINTTIHIGF